LGFKVWGTPRSKGWVGGVMLVLRTFPELVEIGLVVWAWKGEIGT